MNHKSTLAAVLLMAALYGQASQASEVFISEARLASLNGLQIQYLAENQFLRFQDGKAVLDISKLEAELKVRETAGDNGFASTVARACVPYGNT